MSTPERVDPATLGDEEAIERVAEVLGADWDISGAVASLYTRAEDNLLAADVYMTHEDRRRIGGEMANGWDVYIAPHAAEGSEVGRAGMAQAARTLLGAYDG